MPHEWLEVARRPLGIELDSACPAALSDTRVFFARGSRLLIFDGLDLVEHHPLGFEIMSLSARADGTIACNGAERTVILTPKLEHLVVLSGAERPTVNQSGAYALSERYFVYLRGRSAAELVVFDLAQKELLAARAVSRHWLNAPSEFILHSEGLFLASCPQQELTMRVTIAGGELSIDELPSRGAFLGFLAGKTAYAAYSDGRISFSSFPSGDELRSIEVQKLTPITVPDVFTRVAEKRGVTVASAEDMFDDVFVDARGLPVPFAVWTGTLDGETVVARHKDATLRLWRPKGALVSSPSP